MGVDSRRDFTALGRVRSQSTEPQKPGDPSTVAQILGRARHQSRHTEERTFEAEGEVIKSGLRRRVKARDVVMRDLV